MDFDTLARRELQTLCKRNKIPANMTTVAMADALKSLEIVDGIEQLLHERQSESAQPSIESPVRSELSSPHLPPTGGRSTRRRNVVKEGSESVKPATTTRQTARKTLVKNAGGSKADAIETPSVASQNNRKKVQMASACRKMDIQLKECVEEEKKDVLVTPAPSGVTSRRRALKEESTVKRVYSTRRSARLAEKNKVLLNEKENENSGTFKMDLFVEDQTVEMKLKESIECSGEISEITGIHESSEKKDEIEAASAPEQDISLIGGELMSTIEEETGNCTEINGSKPEVKEGGDMEITSSVEKKDKDEIVEENSEENRELISAQELDLSFVPEGEPVCANHFETPSVALQSNQKKVQITLACRKMDMPLKECVEEEKKNVLGTPAPWAVTSRRRASKEESTVKRVYSTRRSARLAEKNMLLLNEKENENSGTFKKDLFAEEQNVKMNLKESLDCSEEISEITGFHESSEQKDVIEVVSAPEQDISVVGGELMSTIGEETGKNYIEANDSKPEVNEGGDMEITSSAEKKDKAEIVEVNSEENREVISAQEQDLSLVPVGEPVSTLEKETANYLEADASKPGMRNVGDDITMTIEEMDGVETIPDQKQDVSIVSEEQLVGTIEEETCNIYGVEVVSVQEQEVSIVSEAEPLSLIEEESGNLFEFDGSKQVVKEGSDVEIQEVGVGFETKTAPEEQKWYKSEDPEDDDIFMLLNVSNEVQENDAYEIHISVENTEEPSTEKRADYEYKAGDLKEILLFGNEDNKVDDVSSDTDIRSETEEEIYNGKDMNSEDVAKVNVNDNAMEIKYAALSMFTTEVYVDVSAKALNSTNSTDLVILEEAKEEPSNDIIHSTDDPTTDLGFDFNLMNEEAEAKMKLDFSNWNAVIAELSQEWDAIAEKTESKLELQEMSPEINLENVAAEPNMPLDAFDSNSYLTLTPIIGSAIKASATKKRLTATISDNKENIGSGSKLILTKERAKVAKDTAQNAPKLDALSRRKLSKLLKEQLEINNKCSKSENENEAPARQALQALSENQ